MIGRKEPEYKAYRRKGQIAVNFLYRKKEGQVKDAIFHKKIGWIDIVWGKTGTAQSDGFGLSKIAKYHPEVMPKLANIVGKLPIISVSKNRFKLGDGKYTASIRRTFDGVGKNWLLTAFKNKEA